MFERYTERARRVIFFARYEASVLGSSSIETEHLLLGLLREGEGVTRRILESSQLERELVEKEVERRGAPRSSRSTSTSVDIPLSTEARAVLQHAAEEADRMGSAHIGVPHLLLGLLREPASVAGEILASKGLKLEDVREEIRLHGAGSHPPQPREAFHKLVSFLRRLEERRVRYHISSFREEAIRVEVAVPEERWAATFFADGHVAVEVFSATGGVQDESALARLLDRLGPAGPGET